MDKNKSIEKQNEKKFVPIWEKSTLTIEEAALYSGIGRNKLRQLTDDENCPFVLWIGSKRLIKRKLLDEHIEKMFSL
ncbi:excisionase [Sporofaciens musculi]|uniref:excisionase n=1 Tax=Sporofaciens musculi TaxID=2681861 RepID=UPI001FCB628D|nr:excisionase [Sporofaciens musculi]